MSTIKTAFTLIASLCLAGCIHAGTNGELDYLYEGLPFEMARVGSPVIPAGSVTLTDFGAVGDGVHLCTGAFADAVAALDARGGGRLVIPRGIWLTGPVELCSNMDLHLQQGAVILFSPDFDLYPIIETWFEGLPTLRCASPLTVRGKHDVSITGSGVIDGSGQAWRPVKKVKRTASEWSALVASGGVLNDKKDIWFPSLGSKDGYEMSDMNVPRGLETKEQWLAVKDFLRPVMVSIVECERMLLEGVTFRNSPAWNIHPMLTKDLIVKGVTINNPWFAQNGDGLDIESCDGVLVLDSAFDVGDDAICIKSGKDAPGRERGRPSSNIIVDGCTVYHGHGGFVVGSEMSGGANNISVSNCTFLGTDVGLRFKSVRGRGGLVENIFIRDIVMTDIPTEPLLFDLFYGGKSAVEALEDGDNALAGEVDAPVVKADETTPAFRNIDIRRVVCNGAGRAMFFNGLPEMNISGITVEDCTITAVKGAQLCEADGVTLRNLKVIPTKGAALMLNNVKNLSVEGFKCPPDKLTMTVAGSRNKNITVEKSDITAGNSVIAPQAAAAVSFK